MPLLSGADEVGVGNFKDARKVLEACGVAIREFAGPQALALSGLYHLETVLVGAGEKEHLAALEPAPAGDRVGRDHLVGMPNMRLTVGIGDRSGDVIGV